MGLKLNAVQAKAGEEGGAAQAALNKELDRIMEKYNERKNEFDLLQKKSGQELR